ncbi:hypothetical protein TRAPUB_6785 [Trametes pubescens]|uniref:Uncharacterized protein n=1 Tax=Trametes pubescens TaxID=154538 RepID=A0A1M2V5A9_TRAPU|nr:hypothetical protein TRAPUB_6785 [Trametes pubescens]
MPRAHRSRRSCCYRNNHLATPTPSNSIPDPPPYQSHQDATSIPAYPVPTWLCRAQPTYDHLPRLPASSWSNGTLTDQVGWTLLHPNLCCEANSRLSHQCPHLVSAADRYHAIADLMPALQLMEKFVLVHPRNDRYFHREVRAALATALVHAYFIADSSLSLIIANLHQAPALRELLPPANPAHGCVTPNPAFDRPAQTDYQVRNLYHRETEVWENLISDNTSMSTASSAGWGAPHWDFDSNKENKPPANDETPHPEELVPLATPSSSMPSVEPVNDQETSNDNSGSDGSLSDNTARALLNWMRDRVHGNHVIFGSPAMRNLLTRMIGDLNISSDNAIVISDEAPLRLRFTDNTITVIDLNEARLPMEGQA